MEHATSTAGNTVIEMGGSAREIVLDIVSEFGCRNDSGGIYKLTSFTLGYYRINDIPNKACIY